MNEGKATPNVVMQISQPKLPAQRRDKVVEISVKELQKLQGDNRRLRDRIERHRRELDKSRARLAALRAANKKIVEQANHIGALHNLRTKYRVVQEILSQYRNDKDNIASEVYISKELLANLEAVKGY